MITYPGSADGCTPGDKHSWIVQLDSKSRIRPSAPLRVQLRRVFFDLGHSAKLHVDVYGSVDCKSNKIGRYTHSNPPPRVIESKGNTLCIVFQPISSYLSAKFNFTYQNKGLYVRCIELAAFKGTIIARKFRVH